MWEESQIPNPNSEPNPFNLQDSGLIKAYGNEISKI